MKVVIGNPVAPKYLDTFVAEVSFMHGDADGYTDEILTLSRAQVLQLKAFMDAYAALPWNKRCCDRGAVTSLPNYWSVFTTAETEEDLEKGWYDDLWPSDMTNDNGYPMIDALSIYYYDENGIKYNVSFDPLADGGDNNN